VINPYRRHVRACEFRPLKSKHWKCDCPIWADGSPLKNPRNLRTTDWNVALMQIAELASGGAIVAARPLKQITLADASAAFFADPDAKHRSKERVRKQKTLHKQFLAFAARRRATYVDQVDPDLVADFRTWFSNDREDTRRGREGRIIRDSHLAANKKTENLRQFFKFALNRDWIAKDPTSKITLRPVPTAKKKGFEPREQFQILEQAAKDIVRAAQPDRKANALRTQALVLFLRYSGLRISDAVGCPVAAIQNGRVFLTCGKNKSAVSVQLPQVVTDALAKIPRESEEYFFWRGTKLLTSRVGDYQAYLSGLFKRAGIVGGHAHRFRHTFAISLLEQPGKTLQDVADALGDTLAVVQKHYSGHSEAKQKRIDEAVRDTWRNDPVLAMLDAPRDTRRHSGKGVN
jgi:site-specific recombinase XerD